MGSNLSQLKKYIDKGDEKKCLEIYYKHTEIRRKLNANHILEETTGDTYMHVSAKKGMIALLKLMLYEKTGNPNIMNHENQNVLHLCCDGVSDSVQYECMQLLLQWHEKAKIKRTPNKLGAEININEQDIYDNTPLHYAAMRNLFSCVQSLVAHGAYLFVENLERSTPCDLAEKYGNKDIAMYLESKMIFSKEDDKENTFENEALLIEKKHNYGLRIQDLQEEKDKLLLEAAEMLNCNIFTAEIMLKKHSWSKEILLNSWMQDPIKCYEKCGLENPNDNNNNKNNCQEKTVLTENTNNTNYNDNIDKISTYYLDSNNLIARRLSGRYLYNNNSKSKTSNMSLNCSLKSAPKSRGIKKHSIPNDNMDYNDNKDKQSEYLSNVDNDNQNNGLYESTCQICFLSFTELEKDKKPDKESLQSQTEINEIVKSVCGHKFCKSCWEQYLTMKIKDGNVNDIVCPQLNCYAIISNEKIESLVSTETAKRYLHFDINAFVDSNPNIKWCPFPGCGMAVKNPHNFINKVIHKKVIIPDVHEQHNIVSDYSTTVDCGQGHFFCWDCLQEGHEPASCQNWKDWFNKIREVKPETLMDTSEKAEQSANYLWLVTNSKSCPNTNCLAPIQKHEGCNHVKCYKCKYEFCWLCLEQWKKHSGSTGGYFQCNRYEATNKIFQKTKATITEAEESYLKAVEENKFVHYYSRFKNHEHSYKIEEPLLTFSKTKFESIITQDQITEEIIKINIHENSLNEVKSKNIESASDSSLKKNKKKLKSKKSKDKNEDVALLHLSYNIESLDQTNDKNIKNEVQNLTTKDDDLDTHLFIEEAIKELLKARRILRCSYIYGYYLDQFGHRKFIFEYIQTEFEESTENLSQIIARPHLKTSRNKIIHLTNILRRKRIEFLDTIRSGLNSFNETPPAFKKFSLQRWKYLLKDNIQHDEEFKNTVAVNLKELNPKNPWIIDKKGRHTNLIALLNDMPDLENELDSILVPSKGNAGSCARSDCSNVRAVNTLSGSICNYCSIKCMRIDRNNYLEKNDSFKRNKSIAKTKTESFDSIKMVQASTSKKIQNNESPKPSANNLSKQGSIWKDFKNKKKISSNSEDRKKISSLNSDSSLSKEIDRISNEEYDNKYFDENYNEKEVPTEDSDNKLISNILNEKESIVTVKRQNTDETHDQIKITSSNKKHTKILQFESLFLNKDEKDVSNIIKNMENVLYDRNDSKIDKVCNFQVKSKK